MTPITLRTERPKVGLMLGVSVVFVICGAILVSSGKNVIVGVLSVLFFGACGVVLFTQLLDARPRLIIDDEGVFDRTLKVGTIQWEDILDAQVGRAGGQPFIALRLRNASDYTNRLSAVHRRLTELNKALDFEALNLNLSALDADPYALAALIVQEADMRRLKGKSEPYRA